VSQSLATPQQTYQRARYCLCCSLLRTGRAGGRGV